MAVRIEAFDPGLHDTKDFRCGSDSQDNFLRRTAKRQQRDGYTRLYVATDAAQVDEPRACLGFYAINAHATGVADVPSDAAPRAPRSNLIPGVFLSHLAVDRRHQGQGLGRILLVDAMQQCQRAGQILGVRRRKLSWLSLPQVKSLVSCKPGSKASIRYATGSGAHDLVLVQLPSLQQGGRWRGLCVEGGEQGLV
ncbi:MAG: GNAT family N-acetyltransferase, partial [Cyanobium sp.]